VNRAVSPVDDAVFALNVMASGWIKTSGQGLPYQGNIVRMNASLESVVGDGLTLGYPHKRYISASHFAILVLGSES